MYNEFLTKAAECYTLQSMQKKRTKMKQTIFMKDEEKKTMPKWQKPGCASSGAIFTDTVGHCAKNGAFLTHGTDDLRHMYISSTTSLLSYDHLKRPLMV